MWNQMSVWPYTGKDETVSQKLSARDGMASKLHHALILSYHLPPLSWNAANESIENTVMHNITLVVSTPICVKGRRYSFRRVSHEIGPRLQSSSPPLHNIDTSSRCLKEKNVVQSCSEWLQNQRDFLSWNYSCLHDMMVHEEVTADFLSRGANSQALQVFGTYLNEQTTQVCDFRLTLITGEKWFSFRSNRKNSMAYLWLGRNVSDSLVTVLMSTGLQHISESLE